jgi:hypothetical protein
LLIGRLANDGKEKAALAALVFEDWREVSNMRPLDKWIERLIH